MTTKKLRWGILGAARVNERLLPAIANGAKNSQLVAIASRREGATAETLQKYAPHLSGQVASYNNFEALLNDPNVDAVYIPLANEEHGKWAVQAIQHGKHVLIEKPFVTAIDDVKAIAHAAQQHHVKAMEGFMYHFHPQHARIQALIDSGLIGEVRYVKSAFSFMMRPARLYRLNRPPEQGGGAMWDIGPYAIHTLRRWFKQAPQSVIATAKYAESGADIATSGIIDFGDGLRGHFDTSFECSRQSEYTIIGTLGGIKCHKVWQLPDTSDVPEISWWCDDGRKGSETFAPANHFNLEIEHFSDCVIDDKSPALDFNDALVNCQTIAAVLQSASTGKRVIIPSS